MKAIVDRNKLEDQCRTALREFWNDSLEIESSREGIVIALPLMLPDGIQVAIELRQVSSNAAILSDRGEVLSALVGQGLEIEASKVQSILAERIATFELERDGWELRKALRFPLRGISIPFATGILPKFVTLFLVFTFGNRSSKALEKTL
jgi:hypothetical protein